MKYLHNAKFYLEGNFANPVTALLVDAGRIVKLLSSEDPVQPSWEKVDLRGGWVYPAFIDAHTHSFSGGLYEDGVDLSACASIDEVLSL
ncbi:MAG: amidohydrolase family protein, partial [Candidatus Cloacimonetes bacterium]|nr:amidohydrolase family protein [Candidatus Cloacimonadota bacterium]